MQSIPIQSHLYKYKHLNDFAVEFQFLGGLSSQNNSCNNQIKLFKHQLFTFLFIWFDPVHLFIYLKMALQKQKKCMFCIFSVWLFSESGQFSINQYWWLSVYKSVCEPIWVSHCRGNLSGKKLKLFNHLYFQFELSVYSFFKVNRHKRTEVHMTRWHRNKHVENQKFCMLNVHRAHE